MREKFNKIVTGVVGFYFIYLNFLLRYLYSYILYYYPFINLVSFLVGTKNRWTDFLTPVVETGAFLRYVSERADSPQILFAFGLFGRTR